MSETIPRLHLMAHHGSGWISRAIQLQTRSRWNHISVRIDDLVYEAIEGVGVRARSLDSLRWAVESRREEVQALRIVSLPVDAVDGIRNFLQDQLGKPYDYTMALRFVSRRNRQSERSQDAWFCSELAYAACMQAGVYLLRDTSAWEVSPGLLVRSPLLRAESREDWPLLFGAAP